MVYICKLQSADERRHCTLQNKKLNNKKRNIMGINANKKVKRRKVRVSGNKNSTNNWNLNAAGWNATHKVIINAE